MRSGVDDGLGKLERPPSLRLSPAEHGTFEASTPQGEDVPSPVGSQNSATGVFEITHINHIVCFAVTSVFFPPADFIGVFL